MIRLYIYLMLIGLAGYFLYRFLKPASFAGTEKHKFRKNSSKQNWTQVYETASTEEAERIQYRLQEEGIECILYQQGKKDIYGNLLQGVGIAVPKSFVSSAQKIISRIPV